MAIENNKINKVCTIHMYYAETVNEENHGNRDPLYQIIYINKTNYNTLQTEHISLVGLLASQLWRLLHTLLCCTLVFLTHTPSMALCYVRPLFSHTILFAPSAFILIHYMGYLHLM